MIYIDVLRIDMYFIAGCIKLSVHIAPDADTEGGSNANNLISAHPRVIGPEEFLRQLRAKMATACRRFPA